MMIIDKLDKADVERISGKIYLAKLLLAKTYIDQVSIPTLELFKDEMEKIMTL